MAVERLQLEYTLIEKELANQQMMETLSRALRGGVGPSVGGLTGCGLAGSSVCRSQWVFGLLDMPTLQPFNAPGPDFGAGYLSLKEEVSGVDQEAFLFSKNNPM